MSEHLSDEQISKWIAGERDAAAGQHVGECAECRAEVARMESTLAVFRDSVHRWSDSQTAPAWKIRRTPSFARRPLSWALSAAAVLALALVPIYRNEKEQQRKAEAARVDAMLLQQIEQETSRTVPSSMDPLVKMVAWDSTTTNEKGSMQ